MEQLQSPESLPSSSRTPEERLARRRVRRWKRRARIAGPFLGVSLLFAALSLSVNLIEYEPMTEPDRLSDRPMYLETPKETERVSRRVSLTADSVGSVNSVLRDGQRQIVADDVIERDLGIPTRPETAIPTPPTLMR